MYIEAIHLVVSHSFYGSPHIPGFNSIPGNIEFKASVLKRRTVLGMDWSIWCIENRSECIMSIEYSRKGVQGIQSSSDVTDAYG